MEERIKELSKYRYETSLEDLEDARIMYENGRYKNALNRASAVAKIKQNVAFRLSFIRAEKQWTAQFVYVYNS